jgi:hypothetical protein
VFRSELRLRVKQIARLKLCNLSLSDSVTLGSGRPFTRTSLLVGPDTSKVSPIHFSLVTVVFKKKTHTAPRLCFETALRRAFRPLPVGLPLHRNRGVLPRDRTGAAALLHKGAPTRLLLSPPPRALLAGGSTSTHRGAPRPPARCHPPLQRPHSCITLCRPLPGRPPARFC